MQRLTFPLALVVAAVGVATFLSKFEIRGLDQVQIRPREGTSPSAPRGRDDTASAPAGDVQAIRIASFNIQAFGEAKLAKPAVMDVLVDVMRRFDVIAIQEVRARNQQVLPEFVDHINAQGAQYDFVIGPRVGRTSSTEQYAFVFNRQTVEVDHTAIYTVDDPDDLLHREPLAAAFRVRGPPPEQAFTFTLINMHTDPDEVAAEMNVMDDVYLAVQRDGRSEDDIILLGDLNADDRHLGEVGRLPNLVPTVAGTATNTRGTHQYDHILVSSVTTREYTGRSGVFDLVREYNLSTAEALQISDHCPVWAEFSLYESGQPDEVARRTARMPRGAYQRGR